MTRTLDFGPTTRTGSDIDFRQMQSQTDQDGAVAGNMRGWARRSAPSSGAGMRRWWQTSAVNREQDRPARDQSVHGIDVDTGVVAFRPVHAALRSWNGPVAAGDRCRKTVFEMPVGSIPPMNLAMMGIVGAVAGCVVSRAHHLLKSALDSAAPRRTSEAERRHQWWPAFRAQRDTTIKLWRMGLEGTPATPYPAVARRQRRRIGGATSRGRVVRDYARPVKSGAAAALHRYRAALRQPTQSPCCPWRDPAASKAVARRGHGLIATVGRSRCATQPQANKLTAATLLMP